MAKKKKTNSISDRARRAMPYEVREAHYNREKNLLIAENASLPSWKMEEALKELARKWDI